jgi:glycosyltransferase involved in cell wall biosynthesis
MKGCSVMRIGIDYTAAIHQRAGIGRHVREVVAALAALDPPAGVRLFVGGSRRPELPPPPGAFTYAPAPLSEMTLARMWHRFRAPVPVEIWTGRIALFHGMDFLAPPTLPGVRTVVTVHDLSFVRDPESTMPGMLRYLSEVVPRAARRADAVIVTAQATKDDLVALYGLNPAKITVMYSGVPPMFRPVTDPAALQAVRRKFGLGEAPFVLTVGTLQPRKNHARLVRAFAKVDRRFLLVIAGDPGWSYDETMQAIDEAGLGERVRLIGYVSDELPALYSAATALAFPSLYEGFGFPPAEAMGCGTPVVVSNVSSLPEVVGDAGLQVDPLDVEALAGALVRLTEDEALRADLRERGLAQAARFTWANAAEILWNVYCALLGI